MGGTRVVLADGQALFRGAIRALIDSAGSYEVIAEASDGPELLACIEQHEPDVVVLDMALRQVDGPEVIRRSRAGCHRAHFLLLLSGSGRRRFEAAFQASAAGYVSKADSAMDFLAAIEAVRGGLTFLSRSASDHLVEIALRSHAPGARTRELSIRELEVLRRIADGLSANEIAAALHISVRTVDSHRSSLMQKLGIHKVAGLVRFAIREGLLDP